MKIRAISVSNDGDGGWLAEFERDGDKDYGIRLTVVVALPRCETDALRGPKVASPLPLKDALPIMAQIARSHFDAMIEFNRKTS